MHMEMRESPHNHPAVPGVPGVPAVAAVPGVAAVPADEQRDQRDGTVQPAESDAGSRNRLLARDAISAAQDVLLERYRLASAQTAFDLLRETSQRLNIKMHTLADAVVRVPGPGPGADLWFPGRGRSAPPPLPLLGIDQDRPVRLPEVLKAAMRRVLDVTETDMGNVQLAAGNGVLRLERHTGLDRQFTDFFAFVGSPNSATSCGYAAEQRRQVTVRDVSTADLFDEESRRVILRAGSRACHSVPLVDPHGVPLGMISSHHERPLNDFSAARIGALRETGTAVGRWLSWYRRTTVLDALEDLHRRASGAASAGPPSSASSGAAPGPAAEDSARRRTDGRTDGVRP
ncbi:ANTAR domain-containing protein [Streptomyces uncialis]|uniref:GAF and ANTAR domain-containing protein n=1 Tax=Streptomyces uncialis TaxID=1048205 RepID=UPI002E3518EB|nr:GAF domain-containing protein [Streptomyces uncialis]